jgi:hypothetical protein
MSKRSFKPEWIWQAVEALRLHLENPGDKPYTIYQKLDDLIEAKFGQKAPAQSKLLALIDQTISYWDTPQPPPQPPQSKKEKKGK